MFNILIFPIRFLVFTIGFFFYIMEEATDWLVGAFAKTEYIKQGECNRCGRCCHLLVLEMPRYMAKRDYLIRPLIWWHKVGLNFHFEGKEKNWLFYSCGYFGSRETPHPENGEGPVLSTGEGPVLSTGEGSPHEISFSCRIYPFRHRLCRQYPKQRLYRYPKIHRECGFKFKRRDGKPSFDEVLEEKSRFVYQNIPPAIEGKDKI